MPQSFVHPSDIQSDQFFLRGSEAHHVVHVLRSKPNQFLFLFDGQGRQFKGVITKINKEDVIVEGKIVEVLSTANSKHHLRLFQGIPKGSKMDYIIEKSVELGVDEIIPYLSKKSVVTLSPPQATKKTERWNRLTQAATKQCQRSTLPTVSHPVALVDLGGQINKGVSLVFSGSSKSVPLKQVLVAHRSGLLESACINMIVGPESGLSESEVDWLVGLGAHVVSLGPWTLRTETAGLAALAMVRYELGIL